MRNLLQQRVVCLVFKLRWWLTGWLRLAGTSGGHLVPLPAQTGPPRAACPAPHPRAFEHLRAWRLHPLCGQPVPALSHPHCVSFPCCSGRPSCVSVCACFLDLVTGHQWEPASILSAHTFDYFYTLMRSPWASSSPGWTALASPVSCHGWGVAVPLIPFMVLQWTLSCSSVPLLLGSLLLQVCLHQGWAESWEITGQMQLYMLEMESKHHLIAADDVNWLHFILWISSVGVSVLGSWPQEFPSKVLYGTCIGL